VIISIDGKGLPLVVMMDLVDLEGLTGRLAMIVIQEGATAPTN